MTHIGLGHGRGSAANRDLYNAGQCLAGYNNPAATVALIWLEIICTIYDDCLMSGDVRSATWTRMAAGLQLTVLHNRRPGANGSFVSLTETAYFAQTT